jgi:hypothetical protein
MSPTIIGDNCDPKPILEKIDRTLSSEEWSKWLTETMQAFASALVGVSERRMADVIASLFLAQVGSGVYAAQRTLGESMEESLEEAKRVLCKIYRASLLILEEMYREGELERNFSTVLKELVGSSEPGKERGD